MAKFLNSVKAESKRTLQAIPKRQQFLQQRSRVSQMMKQPEVLKVAGFIGEPDSDEYASWRQFAAMAPNAPHADVLAAAAVIGLRHLTPAITEAAGRINGKVTASRPPSGKGPARLPGTAERAGTAGRAAGTKYQQAKSQLQKAKTSAEVKAAFDKVLEAV
jgi:hypothetical protein